MKITFRETVYSTPWFDLIAKKTDGPGGDKPYFSLAMPDYVSVVAVTPDHRTVLVRQYRPAVEKFTLELPSGHVDGGETPEQAAGRELFEETGYRSARLELLGSLCSDTGRMSNRVWYFLALDAVRDAAWSGPETGVEPVVKPIAELMEDIRQVRFDHSLNLAPVLLALLKNERFRSCAPLTATAAR